MTVISLILLLVILETHGQMFCHWGKYGEDCSKDCPKNCMPDLNRNLTHCQKETGRCSEGCVPGWFEDLCDKACSKNCLRNICNRQNGICTFGCSGNYTGDFCNTPTGTTAAPPGEVSTHTLTTIPPVSATTETTDLAAILVPVFLLVAVVILVVALLLYVRRKQKRGEDIWILVQMRSIIPCLKKTDTANRPSEEVPLRQGETDTDKLEMAEQGESGHVLAEKDDDSTCSFVLLDDDRLPPGMLGQKMKEIQEVFVESESFKKARERLEKFGHVTITGGPGAGKTSMALMLGAEYWKEGYELVLTADHNKVQLADYLHIGKGVCIIFDDIFQTVRSHMDLSGIKHFLYDLHVYLGQTESRSERRFQCLQQEPRQEPRKQDHPHVCVIFAAETNNLESAMSELGAQRIFSSSSRVQISYTKDERKQLWLKYKTLHASLDEDKLTAFENTSVGFPLACKMFSSCVDFQHEHFFEKPLFYITNQLRTIITSLDDKSAALALMVLCDGQLSIGHLEAKDQQEDEAVSAYSQMVSKDDSADRKLQPVCPDIQLTLVSHRPDSQLKAEDVSPGSQLKAEKVFSDSQLKHGGVSPECQVKPEGVSSESQLKLDGVGPDGQLNAEDVILDSQLKDQGVSPESQLEPEVAISESPLKDEGVSTAIQLKPEGVISDSQLKDEGVSTGIQLKPGAHSATSEPKSVGVRSDGQRQGDGDNTDVEAHLQAVIALVKTSSRQGIANAVREFCGTFLRAGTMTTFSHSLVYDVCASIIFNIEPEFTLKHISVKFLLDHIQDQQADPITVSNHKLTIPFSKANGAILVDRMVDALTSGALSKYIWHPIWRHDFITDKFTTVKQHLDYMPEDAKHRILCYACVTGNTNMLEKLVRLCDINRRSLNGWTPLMYAVVFEHMDCFDILVKHRAAVGRCDDNNYNILHLACVHGHVPTVRHVKNVLKDISVHSYTNQFLNTQARTGWTPVMCAVVLGTAGVSDVFIKPKSTTAKKIDYRLRDSNNNTLLHLACQYGSKTTVENLLPHIDINTIGNNGQTPIMCAVLSGRKEVFDLLMSKKADLTLTDGDNNSLLHAACNSHDVTLVVHMKTKLDINVRGNHGWTPAVKVAVNGNKHAFEHLLDQRKANSHLDDIENNLLHLACHGGNVSIVKQLLQMFDINGRGNNGWTPLMLAAVNGVESVFDLLVSKGADIRLRDDYNNSLLHLACIGGSDSIVNSLLPKIDINCLGNKGRTSIMVTALHARPKLFELLLSKKAVIKLADDNKDSILHLACEGGNCSIVNYLIPKFGINASGRHRRTPVMAAALAGMEGVFALLVSQNADLTLTDDCGDNVLHLACQGGNTAIVEHLVTYFEAALQGKKEAVDQHGSWEGPTDRVTVENEMTGDFDINSRGRNDETPLMRAVCGGHLDVYKFLVSHKADRTKVDKDGQTLLHLASRHGQLHVIEYIIDSVDINSRDNAGLTPVMTSVICDKVAVFKYLRAKEADLSLVDKAGNNALHHAYKRENRLIAELLDPPQKGKRLSRLKDSLIRPFQSKKERQSQTEQTLISQVKE